MIKYKVIGFDNKTYSYSSNLYYAKKRAAKLRNWHRMSMQVQEYKDGQFVRVVETFDDD